MAFWKKKELNSDEYEKICKKIIDLTLQIEVTSTKLGILQTEFENQRANFNAKLRGKKPEDLNAGQVILPYGG